MEHVSATDGTCELEKSAKMGLADLPSVYTCAGLSTPGQLKVHTRVFTLRPPHPHTCAHALAVPFDCTHALKSLLSIQGLLGHPVSNAAHNKLALVGGLGSPCPHMHAQ